MLNRYVLSIGILLALPALASATDLIVDATGSGGSYKTIGDAMAVALPGDRILVRPGVYPYYEHHVGVPVIGLGKSPADVVVRRIYFHVNTPTTGYDVVISNLMLKSDNPLDTLLLHGNEAGPGTLTLDGVQVIGGGVFVRGGEAGFYLLITNSKVENGYGFSGESVYVGGPGNFVEIRNSKIVGLNADPASSPACIGLRIAGGSKVRLNGSQITGGQGFAKDPALAAGAAGVSYSQAGDVDLRIDGNTTITGGEGFGAPGGDGVTVPGHINLGPAVVSAGNGTPPGQDFGLAPPTPMLSDLHLQVSPNLVYGEGATFITSGETLSLNMSAPSGLALAMLSFDVDVPKRIFVPLSIGTMRTFASEGVSFDVPSIPGLEMQGLEVFLQGAILDSGTGGVLFTNSAAMRVDLQ